ncbi:alcohol dehydrogenase catalytic domain-containing protein [Candidatus Poribacteria bacterium]|nr:alcohol dehydrogenase catalytic domain-containing protein [Candidatus Poribacteria bacterium]
MKAVSLKAPKEVEVIDIPEPKLGNDDVLIDIHYVGLCGSDLNTYRGGFTLASYPLIPGHEVSGVIAEKGPGVPNSIETGDKVVIIPYTNCGICPACRSGRPNCCQFNQTLGVQRDGALRQHIAINYTKIFTGNNLELNELALVEPMSVGYHAANRGMVCETDTVLILGCGTIGIGVIAASARKGATVIATDIDDGKLILAQRFGAQNIINSTKQDVLTEVERLTDCKGVNVAIEAVGLPETYRLAVEAVCYAGRIVYIGYSKKEVTYDTTDFVRKELDIRGSRNALRVFPSVIKMMEKGQFPFTDLITKIYPFNQTDQALADWDNDPGSFTKILIEDDMLT